MTSYAIIETGGKQLRVEPGRFYDVDRIAAEPDAQITLDKVLFVQDDGTISIGQPLVSGASVEATVLRHLRGRKIIVYKMRPKKKTRKKQGHRQELTRLMIDSISIGGSKSKKTTKAEVKEAEAPAVEAETAPIVEEETKSTPAKAKATKVEAASEETTSAKASEA